MNTDSLIQKFKEQQTVSRADIDKLLKSVGKPGDKQEEKKDAVRQLNLKNFQQLDVADHLDDYGGY